MQKSMHLYALPTLLMVSCPFCARSSGGRGASVATAERVDSSSVLVAKVTRGRRKRSGLGNTFSAQPRHSSRQVNGHSHRMFCC